MDNINNIENYDSIESLEALHEAAVCLIEYLNVHGEAGRPFEILRFLAAETIKHQNQNQNRQCTFTNKSLSFLGASIPDNLILYCVLELSKTVMVSPSATPTTLPTIVAALTN